MLLIFLCGTLLCMVYSYVIPTTSQEGGMDEENQEIREEVISIMKLLTQKITSINNLKHSFQEDSSSTAPISVMVSNTAIVKSFAGNDDSFEDNGDFT